VSYIGGTKWSFGVAAPFLVPVNVTLPPHVFLLDNLAKLQTQINDTHKQRNRPKNPSFTIFFLSSFSCAHWIDGRLLEFDTMQRKMFNLLCFSSTLNEEADDWSKILVNSYKSSRDHTITFIKFHLKSRITGFISHQFLKTPGNVK
jgi:hypothetical protein